MTVKQNELTAAHQKIWNKLRMLPDGERILGADLQTLAGVSDRRTFYQIIEDLRTAGIFIGASRNSPHGYYEIRTGTEMDIFLSRKRNQLKQEADILDSMEIAWLRRSEEPVEV